MSIDMNLDELAGLGIRPLPWETFKAEILPSLAYPLVSRKHAAKVRQVIRELEALDISRDGEPPRTIKSTSDLTLHLVARYLASRPPGESPWTTKATLSVVRTLCVSAVRFRALHANPFDIRPLGRIVRLTPPRGKRALSRDEVRRLLAHLRSEAESRTGWSGWRAKRIYVAVAIAAYTGLRRTELLTLHVADVDLDARVIRLQARGELGKGLKSASSAKPVGIPDALVEIIRGWLPWRMAAPQGFKLPDHSPWLIPCTDRRHPWTGGQPGGKALDQLKLAAERCGITGCTFHALRRTLATHLEAHGVGPAMIQRVMRHSSGQVTERHYRQADEQAIAEAMRGIQF